MRTVEDLGEGRVNYREKGVMSFMDGSCGIVV